MLAPRYALVLLSLQLSIFGNLSNAEILPEIGGVIETGDAEFRVDLSVNGIKDGDDISAIFNFLKLNIADGEELELFNDQLPEGGVNPFLNLIANVKGGGQTLIEGRLVSEGFPGARLFLINPSGITLAGEGKVSHSGDVIFSASQPVTLESVSEDGQVFLGDFSAEGKISVEGDSRLLSTSADARLGLYGGEVEIADDARIYFVRSGGKVELVSLLGEQSSVGFGDEGANIVKEDSGAVSISGGSIGRIRSRPTSLRIDGRSITVSGGKLAVEGNEVTESNLEITATGDIDISSDSAGTEIGGSLGKLGRLRIRTKNGEVRVFGDKTLLDISDTGKGAGTVLIEGRTVVVEDKAKIQATVSGDDLVSAGDIAILGGQSVTIRGESLVSNAAAGSSEKGLTRIEAEKTILIDSARVLSTGSSGSSLGGDIRIVSEKGDVSIINSSEVSTETQALGDGGNILVKADQGTVIVAGEVTNVTSGTTSRSSGRGGEVFLSGNRIVVKDGASVSAKSNGTGVSGNVFLQANELEIDGGFVAVSTANNDAGNIFINVRNRLEVTRGGEVSTSARGSAVEGGDIKFNHSYDQTSIRNKDGVDNVALPSGKATLLLMNGRIVTEVDAESTGAGGNVAINGADARNLVILGGGLEINTSAVAGETEKSAQSLNAVELGGSPSVTIGSGGNVTVAALQVYRSPQAVIVTRGSQTGLDGEVRFSTPEIDETSGMVDLPESFMDVSALTSNRCVARYQQGSSSLVVNAGGRESAPPQAFQGMDFSETLVAYQTGVLENEGRRSSVLRVMPVAEVECQR